MLRWDAHGEFAFALLIVQPNGDRPREEFFFMTRLCDYLSAVPLAERLRFGLAVGGYYDNFCDAAEFFNSIASRLVERQRIYYGICAFARKEIAVCDTRTPRLPLRPKIRVGNIKRLKHYTPRIALSGPHVT